MEEIILVGFGGHSKSVADCIERQGEYRIVGYTDLVEYENSRYTYLGTDDVLETLYAKGIRHAVVCIGYLGKGIIREQLYMKLKSINFSLPVIIDPSAIVSESADIGEGTFIGKMSVVNADARIGKMAIINNNTLIEHECFVGDFTHVAVSAVVCGTVKIGKSSFIGANSTIVQSCTLGDHVIVGAGAIVAKNLEDRTIFRHKFDSVLKNY